MDRNEILTLINENPAFFLGTTENGEARVRGMMLYRADDDGFIFHTGSSKDLHKQLTRDPRVEMCFNSMAKGIQVRVRGHAELVNDMKLKEEIVKKRPFLQPWVAERGYDFLAVYRVTGCKACIWTMATNLAEKEFISI